MQSHLFTRRQSSQILQSDSSLHVEAYGRRHPYGEQSKILDELQFAFYSRMVPPHCHLTNTPNSHTYEPLQEPSFIDPSALSVTLLIVSRRSCGIKTSLCVFRY